MLLRADNLQSLSAADVRALVDEHALEVVIDLRTDVEAKLEGSGPMTAERGVRIELRSLYPDSDAIVARLRSSPLYRDELEGRHSRHHAPVPGTIERVLELVDERHGGSAAWLLANGLDASDLRRLRGRLLALDSGSAPEDAPA